MLININHCQSINEYLQFIHNMVTVVIILPNTKVSITVCFFVHRYHRQAASKSENSILEM